MRIDLRFALRLLRRQPAFAAAAWLTLALGVGATTAVYTVVHSVLLRPLPVENEDTLIIASVTDSEIPGNRHLSYPKFKEWRASGAFLDLAAIAHRTTTLTDESGVSRQVTTAGVSLNFFGLVGARAQLGRLPGPDDAGLAAAPAVISDSLWRGWYHQDPAIIGSPILLGDTTLTIVGVMPPGFHRWPREAHVWTSIDQVESAEVLASRGYRITHPVGRLRPGVSLATTAEQIDAADRGTEERMRGGASADRAGVRLESLRDTLLPARTERVLVVLMATVVLTWFVVCANLSGLLLARGSGRATELAVRRAVGADPRRLLRQLMVESATLAIPGGALGAVLAFWAVPIAARFIPAATIGRDLIWVDAHAVAFAAVLVALSPVVFGLLPAVRASNATLQVSSADRVGGRTSRTLRVLLVGEIAIGLVVLVGAALLVKSVGQITRVDLGFEPSRVLSVRVALPLDRYGAASSTTDDLYVPVQKALLARVGELPGVEVATLGFVIFTPSVASPSSIWLDDGRRFLNGDPADQPFAPTMRIVGPDYFRLHGVALLRGRELRLADDSSSPHAVLVNEAMAEVLWPGEEALGKKVNFRGPARPSDDFGEPWHEVVGVVRNIRHAGVDLPARPAVYRSTLQYARREFDLIVRTAIPPGRLAGPIRDAVRGVAPGIVMYETRRLADVVDDAHAEVTYSSAALSGLAGITSLLAAFGVYGVLAYAVARQRREIGIRIALGAARQRIALGVARQVIGVVLPGLVVGVVAAVLSAHLLGGLLYDVTPRDPAVLVGAALLLTLIASLAGVVPARAASRIDPIIALRE